METVDQVTLAAPPINIIEEGGYRIDTDTGEVLGLIERVEKWQPTDVAGVAWVLDKMQRCDADARREADLLSRRVPAWETV